MSYRGDATRKTIIENSKELFIHNGFAMVTMKDVAEASGISRSGLYRHYSNTGEILTIIINEEQVQALEALEEARRSNLSAATIFRSFLNSRIHNISDRDKSLDKAVSEYAEHDESGERLMQERARSSIRILAGIIEDGAAEGTMKCADAVAAAKHIIWMIEGMAKHNAIIQITEEEIEQQIRVVYDLLGMS